MTTGINPLRINIYMSLLEKYQGYVYYLTHNNGSYSYCVYVDTSTKDVNVYTGASRESVEDFTELVASYETIDKIFIGKSPLTCQTLFSGAHGPRFDGNSILLKIHTNDDTNKYLFIGTEMYSFTAENEITSFFSPVGNNDVPYPFAMDYEKNYYFFTEYAVMKINDVSSRNDPYDFDDVLFNPYEYLYSVVNNIGDTENIECLYSGDERYQLTTSPRPAHVYTELISRDGGPISIEYGDQTKKELSKEEYVELLTKYNQTVGLELMSDITMIHNI